MIVKNISPDARSLFDQDAPPLLPGDQATVSDARGVGRAWPKSTWEVVEPPEGCADDDTEDAYVFTRLESEAEPTTTKAGKR